MPEQRQRPRRRPREDADTGTNDATDNSDSSDSGEDRSGNKSVTQVSKDDNTRPDTTATLEPLTNAQPEDWLGDNRDPDVMLAIPNLGVDHIGIEVDNIRAHVELHAKVLDLLELHVGAHASIDKVQIEIDNVRVQAMLKVNLQEVTKIVGRVMDTIDQNPEILTNLTKGIGEGVEGALKGGTGGSDDSTKPEKSIEGSSKVEKDEKSDKNGDDA